MGEELFPGDYPSDADGAERWANAELEAHVLREQYVTATEIDHRAMVQTLYLLDSIGSEIHYPEATELLIGDYLEKKLAFAKMWCDALGMPPDQIDEG